MLKSIHSTEQQIFCDLLRAVRKRAGVTQIELAARLGWEQTHVSRCERGGRRLDMLEARLWLKALGADLAGFAAELDEKLSANSPPR